MVNWSRKETSKLISYFHQQPILYCQKHPLYSSRQSRHEALSTIYKQIIVIKPNIHISDVKSRLRNLRTQYVKEKSLMLKSFKDGEGEIYVPKLWCFEELQIFDLEYPPDFHFPKSVDEEDSNSEIDQIDPLMGEKPEIKKPSSIKTEFSDQSEKSGETQNGFELCSTPQARLGKLVEWELLQVPDIVFYETKWKIMRLLESASKQSFSYLYQDKNLE